MKKQSLFLFLLVAFFAGKVSAQQDHLMYANENVAFTMVVPDPKQKKIDQFLINRGEPEWITLNVYDMKEVGAGNNWSLKIFFNDPSNKKKYCAEWFEKADYVMLQEIDKNQKAVGANSKLLRTKAQN